MSINDDTTPTPNPHAELIAELRRESYETGEVSPGNDLLTRAADALAARPQPTEVEVENRLHFQYGINPVRSSSGRASHDELQQRIEGATSGLVDVVKREQRRVTYGPWEEVTR